MQMQPEYAQYIAAYTSGVIPKRSVIKIKLQQTLDTVPEKLISFSPKIEGSYVLESDNKTLTFTPKKALEPGQVYTATFELEKIIDNIDDDLEEFVFQFQTITQNFTNQTETYRPYTSQNLAKNKITGTVITADQATTKELNNFIVAKQNGMKLSVAWESKENGTFHKYTVKDVSRTNKTEIVDLKFNADAIGAEKDEKLTYNIPALGIFQILDILHHTADEPYTSIYFTDPIVQQDLQGLIYYDNSSPEISSYEINLNEVKVYCKNNTSGKHTLNVYKGIKNVLNQALNMSKSVYQKEIAFSSSKPSIELIGDGNIIPKSDKLLFPFAATGLKGVHVKVFKIFENNIVQFFQQNDYNGSYQLREVGKPVYEQDVMLTTEGGIRLDDKNVFSLDLAKFVAPEPGAIYRVELSMRPYLSNASCMKNSNLKQMEETKGNDEDWSFDEYDGDYYEYYDYFYPDGYDWEERDNPCDISYYTSNRNVSRNVIASNFGIISKISNDKELDVTVTNLLNTEPLDNIKIKVYDYQNQLIAEDKTNGDGFVKLKMKAKPFVVVAEKNKERGYLKLTNGGALNMSQFNVSGVISKDGLKGFIYGERGVWRPGDEIYLTCVLQNNLKKIPDNYPVKLSFYSPDNQMFEQIVNNTGVNGFYIFKLKTPADAPTGNWRVKAKAGNYEITKTIKIETIKPNKLKVDLSFSDKVLNPTSSQAKLKVAWLHGAIASNLKANITATVFSEKTTFDNYPNYNFDDPTRKFDPEEIVVFDGKIDDEGNASIPINLKLNNAPSGKLKVGFFSKVFENGGEFSTQYATKSYSPYSSYVGMHANFKNKDWEMLETDRNHAIKIVSVDGQGRPIAKSGLKVSLYKLKNNWWYSEDEDESSYMASYYSTLISSSNISTSGGTGSYNLNIKSSEWGRYFMRVEDPESGHSSGMVLWVDWPDWRSRGGIGEEATVLAFKTDKEKYNVGETAEIVIPSHANGRALLSIETGSTILEKRWIKTDEKQTKISIKLTKAMSPNVYANITLLQPHAQTKNDLPIRMFGIAPIMVEDPNSHLQPMIKAPVALEPNTNYTIEVSEKSKQEMTYTLAIVDEGLLDITSYKTPDIWQHFNQKEALGIRTWDIYSAVLGAYNGKIANIFAIGGGDEGLQAINKGNVNRFKPVVQFLGPFTIGAGKSNKHNLKIPNYIGSLKVMVVAGNQMNQFGNAEKIIPVKKALMVSTTLPRVLSPGETINVPITIFADPKLSSANISMQTNGILSAAFGNKTISLNKGTETIINIPVTVGNSTGVAKVKVMAKSGSYSAFEEIEIPVRLPNPPIVKTSLAIANPNEEETLNYAPFGVNGTQEISVEVSTLPHINLKSRLNYLITYPHGCIEQTTSSVFPQLFLSQLMDISETEKTNIENNIKAALERLKSFQLSNGGFSYWPNGNLANDWGSTYAGHFIIEAEKIGYNIPAGLKTKMLSYLETRVNQWNSTASESNYYLGDHQLTQAYRLYTLALANQSNMGGMNRLRETSNLQPAAAWRLAAAYALAGKSDIAKTLMEQNNKEIDSYHAFQSYTYGSADRDMAMKLETYAILKDNASGILVVNRLASALSSNNWMSTQTTAYGLLAVAKFAGQGAKQTLNFDYVINGTRKSFSSNEISSKRISLPLKEGSVKIINKTGGKLFVSLANQGTPLNETIASSSDNLRMSVKYMDLKNSSLNPNNLKQGQDFKVEVTLSNPNTIGDYKDLALSQIFPSGWEIINTRVNDQVSVHSKDIPTYQDIRDDRVYTYFDLRTGQTKTFVVLLNAAYKGSYFLPAIQCQAMYENSIKALAGNSKVVVE